MKMALVCEKHFYKTTEETFHQVVYNSQLQPEQGLAKA